MAAIRRIGFAAGLALALTGCASMEAHRAACSALLARPATAGDPGKTDAPTAPGGPQEAPAGAKPAALDPAVEACAQRRADDEQRQGRAIAAGLLGAILLGAAAGLGGAGRSYRSSPRYYAPPRYYARTRR